jgi:hypothetical protein
MGQEAGVITDDPAIQTMDKYLAGNIYLMEMLGAKTWLTIFHEQMEKLTATNPATYDIYQTLKTNRRKWIAQQAKLIKQLGSEIWLIETITGLIGHTPEFDRGAVQEQLEQLREAGQ